MADTMLDVTTWLSPGGAGHLVLRGWCLTCGRRDHPEPFSEQDNRDWIRGTLANNDREWAMALNRAGAQVKLEMTRR